LGFWKSQLFHCEFLVGLVGFCETRNWTWPVLKNKAKMMSWKPVEFEFLLDSKMFLEIPARWRFLNSNSTNILGPTFYYLVIRNSINFQLLISRLVYRIFQDFWAHDLNT
jgi:hypothetical protein